MCIQNILVFRYFLRLYIMYVYFYLDNTDDNLLSIFDLPKDDTFEKSDANMNENVISYSESVMLTNISKAIIEPNNLLMNKFDTNNLGLKLFC